jgi:Ca2+/Na+ antiporter
MSRLTYATRALLLGLAVCQVIATVQVYLSNADFYRSLQAMREAGFVVVPNERVMPTLRDFAPAFIGGFFFTFTVGAGLSLLGLAAAWLWRTVFRRSRYALFVLASLWLGSLWLPNREILSPTVSAYVLFVPLVVFAAASRWTSRAEEPGPRWRRLVPGACFFLLALLWSANLDGEVFVALRDSVLLSNPLGIRLNDFYYRYSLYPAEAFKSLEQKLLRTCSMENVKDKALARSLEQALIGLDYLPVGKVPSVDIQLLQDGEDLLLRRRGLTLQTPISRFLADPGRVLSEFSQRTDQYAFLRHLTYISLLVALPITVYLFFFSLFRLVCAPFLSVRHASVVASILCLLAGIAIILPLCIARATKVDAATVAHALQSPRWEVKIAALKFLEERHLEIASFPEYRTLLASARIAERYWLVRALGASRQPETYRELISFLDDPHPNVVAMAFYALGRRGEPGAVDEIRRRLEASDHWYSQWYGYRALRTLGWKQAGSTQELSFLPRPVS